MNNESLRMSWQALASPRFAFEQIGRVASIRSAVQLVVVMAVLSAALLGVVDLFTLGLAEAVSGFAKNVVVLPVFALIAWLVISVIMFIVWKILGGVQGFGVAACCVSLLFVLLPLWSLAEIIHSYAQLVVIAWAAVLLIIASQQVFGIAFWKALIAVAVLAVIAVRYSLCGCCDEQQPSEPAVSGPVLSAVLSEQVTTTAIVQPEDENRQADDAQQANQELVIEQDEQPQQNSQQAVESTDTRFSLSPAEAGYKLGEMVREVSDSMAEIGEEFKRGLEERVEPAANKEPSASREPSAGREPSASREPSANQEPSASKEEPSVAKEPSEKNPLSDLEKTPADNASSQDGEQSSATLPALSPEQLGQLLGRFIRDMEHIAQDVEQGYNDGLKSEDSTKSNPAEQAGKALGDFIRGFNDAAGQSLEPDRSVDSSSP